MIAEFSINPIDTEHMSIEIIRGTEILQSTGIDYRLGPMGTCIDGNPDAVLKAIRRCHAAIAGRHERVITTVVIDNRKNEPPS